MNYNHVILFISQEFAICSASFPFRFMPDVHSLNQPMAIATPYAEPAKTWGHV